MENLMAVIGRQRNGYISAKIIFDGREEMPTKQDVIDVAREYFKELKEIKIVFPMQNYLGKYEQNCFDILSYRETNDVEDYDTKVFYENRELIEDFKKNPIIIWCDKFENMEDKKIINYIDYERLQELEKGKYATGIKFEWK